MPIYAPYVIERSSRGERSYDIFSRLLMDRIVFLGTPINDDVATTNWGKYLLFIDTTGDSAGGTSDAWGRNIDITDPHKAEYSLRGWVDNPPYAADHTQFWE